MSIVTAATGAGASLRYAVETSLGTTPTLSETNFLKVNYTPTMTLGITREKLESKILRDDRMPAATRLGNIKVGGNIPIEFMWKEYDSFLESVCYGEWTTNVLKCGKTPSSMTMEIAYTDLATPEYYQFTGCMCDSLDLTIKPNAIVSGTFVISGITGAMTAASLLTTGSPGAAQTYDPYDSFTGTLSEGGSAISTVTDLTVNIKNSISPTFVVGQNTSAAMPAGRCVVTGKMTSLFSDVTLFNKFMNETASTLQFVLGNGTTESYTFYMGKIKYTTGTVEVASEQLISVQCDYTADYDATSGTNLQITRTAS